jgi:hypothetical protein
MPNFNYRNLKETRLSSRYQDGVLGINAWNEFIKILSTRFATYPSELPPEVSNELQLALVNLQENLWANSMLNSSRPCKRVFVSHRHADWPYAERIAWLANKNRWEYWLDVHDHTLIGLIGIPIPEPIKSIIIAGIVEMALINCTHVLAVMTPSTSGSQWVPYEYGRVAGVPGSYEACCWQHPALQILPGYLHLRPIHTDEPGIESWFQKFRSNCLFNHQLPAEPKSLNEVYQDELTAFVQVHSPMPNLILA